MLPRLLILDDLFGRNIPGGRNVERENLCAHFLWQDATGDAAARASRQKVLKPVAEAVFFRGQLPVESGVGAVVENDLAGSLEQVRSGWNEALARGEPPWAMVLLDLCFYTGRVTEDSHRRTPGMPEGRPGDDDPRSYFGLTLLNAIHHEFPDLPIFILSSKPREEVSLEFSRRGALGFIARDDLRGPELLEEALRQHGLLPDPAGEIVGHSLPVLLALREARRAARHRENLLIRGERGSGKELLARHLHRHSSDGGQKPFVAVNSAVFNPALFAADFFGIEPRTATGVAGKTGLVETAQGGDLFLDEIADMPDEVQAAILRVLQERQFTPVGGRNPRNVDVRFIAATNADVETESNGFRADLLDRLRLGGTLWLPPLRERKADIPRLVEAFVREAETSHSRALRREITLEALEKLGAHDWPGNVRELRSCLFDAVNRHPDVEYLVAGHLRIGSERKIVAVASVLQRVSTDMEKPIRSSDAFSRLVETLEQTAFPVDEIQFWAGRLAELQLAQSRLLARYLEAALEATRKRSPEYPHGQIQIHPAIKLLSGDSTITASKAADVIKRLLGPLEEELEGDLREALAIAIRLRPRSPKAANTTT